MNEASVVAFEKKPVSNLPLQNAFDIYICGGFDKKLSFFEKIISNKDVTGLTNFLKLITLYPSNSKEYNFNLDLYSNSFRSLFKIETYDKKESKKSVPRSAKWLVNTVYGLCQGRASIGEIPLTLIFTIQAKYQETALDHLKNGKIEQFHKVTVLYRDENIYEIDLKEMAKIIPKNLNKFEENYDINIRFIK